VGFWFDVGCSPGKELSKNVLKVADISFADPPPAYMSEPACRLNLQRRVFIGCFRRCSDSFSVDLKLVPIGFSSFVNHRAPFREALTLHLLKYSIKSPLRYRTNLPSILR
jgi:hypothetical protein